MTNIWHFLSKVYFLNFCYVFWLNLKRLIRQNRPMIDDKNVLINQYLKIFDTVQYSIRLIHGLWILFAIFCQDVSITKKKYFDDISKALMIWAKFYCIFKCMWPTCLHLLVVKFSAPVFKCWFTIAYIWK